MDLNKLQRELTRDEGRRNQAYRDSKGILTVGIGHNLHKPLSDRAIAVIFEDDVADAVRELAGVFPRWRELSEVRQRVLVNMCFNLGGAGLAAFHQLLAALERALAGDPTGYTDAAREMANSKWHTDVGVRAVRLEVMMRTGQDFA